VVVVGRGVEKEKGRTVRTNNDAAVGVETDERSRRDLIRPIDLKVQN